MASVTSPEKDAALFAQRQSTMDSETLDKLLMAEKNLFQAGQATLQAWKLIGRNAQGGESGSDELEGHDAAQLNGPHHPHHHHHHGHHHHAQQQPQQPQQQQQPPAPRSTPPSADAAPGSPKFPFEIPRPEGRTSLGPYTAVAAGIYAESHAHSLPAPFPLRSTIDSMRTTIDSLALSETNVMAEHGRSRSTHNIFGFSRDTPPRSEVTLFTFTVKKSDSVLEKLGGSKKTSIRIQVDIETRMLNFLSPHENRESYSCAAVTAKPYSRFGVQLKIQTNTASLTKKVTFLSSEDRSNFMDALEQGKVMCKAKGSTSFRATETSVQESFCSTDSSTKVRLRETLLSDQFTLLPAETVLEHVQRVTNLVVMSQSDRAVQGVLKITTFRLTFSPYDSSWKFGSFEVPLAAVDLITRDGLMLLITCKDLRTIRLAMHDAYSRKKGYDQLPSTPDIRWLNLLTVRMKPPTAINALFAFDHYAEKSKLRRSSTPGRKEDGWLVYSPVAEYQRLGFLRQNEDPKDGRDPDERISWRLLKNSKFRFSPTYPQLMIVPSMMSEEQLVQSARFRSRARLPVVVWRHPLNKSVLSRSSQPNYGMAGNRSEADRLLLRAYRDSANTNSSTSVSPPLHIIDARKPIATKGNRLKGKGVENPQHYDNATVEFMGIANIHKMRESLDALKLLVSPSSVEDGDKHYHNRLENTRWLKHVMRVLSGARRIAEVLHEDGASVLVHCSDGWDRTPQLVALAQLILDPYYRTIRGFAVLVEKEWCSFGHKFADRIGVGKDISDLPNERSPVMLQFLDCVWQMTRQFPTCFEFNEKFLLHVADALISGLYGTFLFNSERDRVFEKVWERTESVWTPVLEDPAPFKNPLYRQTNRVLYPRANLKRVVLWDAMFFRWDPESHPDYMEFMVPMVPDDDDDDTKDSAQGDDSRTNSAQQLVSPPQLPISAELEAEEKALRLEIDVIHDYDEMRSKTALSDCSDMSDDEEPSLPVSVPSVPTLSTVYSTGSVEESLPAAAMEQDDYEAEMLERYRRGAEERTRQRAQNRNLREALKLAPDHSRIKYLEQLLSESVARELQLEAELDSIHHRTAMKRAARQTRTR